MNHPADSAEPADDVGVSHHLCPLCGGNLIRAPRRSVDRFWSLFVPVHRYRCNQFACQWTGNLRIDSSAENSATQTPP